MNALTRFEEARRILGHEITLPVDVTERICTFEDTYLCPANAGCNSNLGILHDENRREHLIRIAKVFSEYALLIRSRLDEVEWDEAAGVSVPFVNVTRHMPTVEHVTCTGRTELLVRPAWNEFVGLEFIISRPQEKFNPEDERDRQLMKLADNY